MISCIFPIPSSFMLMKLQIQPIWLQLNVTFRCMGVMLTISFKFCLVPHAGDFDLLGYEVFEGNNVTLEITEQTRGKPNLETFTLNWDGIASKPLAPESSEAEVCSRNILPCISSGSCPVHTGYSYTKEKKHCFVASATII